MANKNNGQKNYSPKIFRSLLIGLLSGLIVLAGTFATKAIVNNVQDDSQDDALAAPKISGEPTATKAYDRINPAVVHIDIFEEEDDEEPFAIGSGVVYSEDGPDAYIVTNNHVADAGGGLKVTLSDETELDASVVGTDILTDLAVIKVDSKKIKTVAEFGDSSKVKVGESVIAVGSPVAAEFSSSVTQGIISAKNRVVDTDFGDGGISSTYGGITVMQTDAAINPGNSGGPLVNLAGQVIGINSIKLTGGIEGMGFAIPSKTVVDIANKLIKDGEVTRPSLGIELINLAEVEESDRDDLDLPDDVIDGVVILDVEDGSPADDANLEKNDVIVGMDGKSVGSQVKLRDALYKHDVGDTIEVTYYRGDTKKTANVRLNKELKIEE